VLRLIALFIAFALMFNNGTTVALAMCQHGDSQAHASARSSADQELSSAAMAEEAAERSVTHSKSFSDGSPGSFVAFVLASKGVTLLAPQSGSPLALPSDERLPPSGSIAPLLRPPLR
jgi:hypothetical protein